MSREGNATPARVFPLFVAIVVVTTLQLPPRDEVLVAKQAAVIDRLRAARSCSASRGAVGRTTSRVRRRVQRRTSSTTGRRAKIAEEVARYADAIDILVLFPQIPDLRQVQLVAEHVLPDYR